MKGLIGLTTETKEFLELKQSLENLTAIEGISDFLA